MGLPEGTSVLTSPVVPCCLDSGTNPPQAPHVRMVHLSSKKAGRLRGRRPAERQAEPGHSQQSACASTDPSTSRRRGHRVCCVLHALRFSRPRERFRLTRVGVCGRTRGPCVRLAVQRRGGGLGCRGAGAPAFSGRSHSLSHSAFCSSRLSVASKCAIEAEAMRRRRGARCAGHVMGVERSASAPRKRGALRPLAAGGE